MKRQYTYTKEENKAPKVFVEKIINLQSSTAGAGSGEFHHYHVLKKRERARELMMEREVREDKITSEFDHKLLMLKEKDEERTSKLREKR